MPPHTLEHGNGETNVIGYVTIGTNDLGRATAFYDFLFGFVGIRRVREEPGRWVAWGASPASPSVAVAVPHNRERATAGNGAMVALEFKTAAEVAAVHALAVALGGSDEGAPGPREDGRYFAAFFRDRDGNKLNAFCELGA
jgi:catechol 2,3-dioxygenase-like lactoylglutathione lyase family enzyme